MLCVSVHIIPHYLRMIISEIFFTKSAFALSTMNVQPSLAQVQPRIFPFIKKIFFFGRNLAARGEYHDPEEVILHNISTCVILDFKELGMVHCSQKMMDQMKLYIGTLSGKITTITNITDIQMNDGRRTSLYESTQLEEYLTNRDIII